MLYALLASSISDSEWINEKDLNDVVVVTNTTAKCDGCIFYFNGCSK